MLTAEQVSFFRAFGFVVVDNLVEQGLLDDLTTEVSSALDAAFGRDPEAQLQDYLAGRGGPRAGAVLGQYLPIMSSSTPTSLSLAESENLVHVSQQILDTTAPIAKPAKAVRYISPSGWHRDCGSGVSAVKVVYYLDSVAEITFELVPASHLGPVEHVVRQLLGERGDKKAGDGSGLDLPTTTVHLKRHQALIFDVSLWHRNPSSSERIQWSVTYIAAPVDAEEIHKAVSFIGSFFGKHPGYDTDKFPFFPHSWIDGSSDSILAQNMNRTGVMKEFVDRYAEFL